MSLRACLDGESVLASASSVGHITLWDLAAGGRLLHIIRGAHDAAVSAVEWIPGQPVLISSSADNSIKVCGSAYIRTDLFIALPLAMAVRFSDRTTSTVEIPGWSLLTTAFDSILWFRRKGFADGFT